MSVYYTIEGRVISKKNSRRIFRRNGRTFNLPSKAWKRFEGDAVGQLIKQKGRKNTIVDDVYIDYCFLMKGKGATDTSNMITSVDDLLESAKIIENDKQVRAGSFRVIAGQPEYVTEVYIHTI